jgi:hypothetical protein
MLDLAGVTATDSIIDIGGGASPLAGALLARGHTDVTVLDVSAAGMDAAQRRLDTAEDRVAWLLGDVRTWRPPRHYAVWHDRALFHFMAAEHDREAYLHTLEGATSRGAVAIFATFAPDGPPRCSGLSVVRYGAEALAAAMGANWHLVADDREMHTTPSGTSQPFTWVAFRRKGLGREPAGFLG